MNYSLCFELTQERNFFLSRTSLCSYFCFFYHLQIIFAKGAHFAMSELTHSEYDVIGLDWTMDIHDARLTAPGQTLMGNLDPCALYANEVFYLFLSVHMCYKAVN